MGEEINLEIKANSYERYKEEIKEDISNTLQEFGVQPILFVGSGLTKRYMNGPSWEELLGVLADGCPAIEKGLAFYKQSLDNMIAIGQEFSNLYRSWAWGNGKGSFPDYMFEADVNKHSYIKFKISEFFAKARPVDINGLNAAYSEEISALAGIKPHAVITTNYDEMLEIIFPDHERIIGQQLLRGQQICIGEIYKIHGCVTKHDSLVLTRDDYDEWLKKKKFLSAKLLTFFNEHPLLFVGYNAGDPNIQAILSDIDEALPEKGGIIPNVYILQWDPAITEESWPQRDKIIQTEDGRSVRVKMVSATNFDWVFDAFAASPALEHVSMKVLRALMARSYDFVRSDIPRMRVEADFKMLNSAVVDSNSFAKLFGIANINDYSAASAYHPYSLTEVGVKLGYSNWNGANKLIEKIEEETGINIKESDNRYHRADKVNKTIFHKYSEDAIVILGKVQKGIEYKLDIK